MTESPTPPPPSDLDGWLEIASTDSKLSARINGPSGHLRRHTDQLTLTQARDLRRLIDTRKADLQSELHDQLRLLDHLRADISPEGLR